LTYPKEDLPFTLATDASDKGLGAILAQYDPEKDKDYVISYASRTLQGAETKYDTTNREALAVKWAIEKFHYYLHGKKFKVITDHSALLAIFKTQQPHGRVGRWVMELTKYDFEVEHRKGCENYVADALSKDPNFYKVNQ
jgi:hypothetical protein